MIPVSRPYPPARDVRWLNPPSPQTQPIASTKSLNRAGVSICSPARASREPGLLQNYPEISGPKMVVRAGRMSGQQCCWISRYLAVVGKRRRIISRSPPPDPKNAGSPHWHPTIQSLSIRQIVAGLWLKYGVSRAKISASSRRKITSHDATIC